MLGETVVILNQSTSVLGVIKPVRLVLNAGDFAVAAVLLLS